MIHYGTWPIICWILLKERYLWLFSDWVSNIVKHAIAAGESVYRLDVKSVEVQDAKTALNNAVKKLGVSPGR